MSDGLVQIEDAHRDLVPIDEVTATVADACRARGERIGCDTCRDPACCEDVVWITDTEAQLIADAVRCQGPRALRRVRRRIARWKEAGLEDVARAAVGGVRPDDYLSFKHPCPLLDRKGRCSVYSARPHACRILFVVGAPKQCREWTEGRGTQQSMVIALARVWRRVAPDVALRWYAASKAPLPAALGGLLR